MAQWKKNAVGDLTLYQASTMSWLPGIAQGFTTRRGGVSHAPYESLNLGAHVGDEPTHVQDNRQRVWTDLGFSESQVALAEQVHGDSIAIVEAGTPTPIPGADALITATPGVLLMLFYADCVPIYVVDPLRRAIALVHAGWRGVASNIVGKTVSVLTDSLGVTPKSCLAAIGPCIGGESYEVGAEVADRFRNLPGGRDSGSATAVLPRNELGGTYTLNLRQIVFTQLLIAGFRAEYIAVSEQDTFRNRRDFFSYRRDGPQTGRMAACLALRSQQRS